MITLKHGKFFNDGKPMPFEFGNLDQIKLLDKVSELMKNDGIAIRVKESCLDDMPFFTEYCCVCGSINKRYWNDDSINYLDKKGFNFKCCGCDLKYTYSPCYWSDFILVLKLNTKK